MTTRYIQRTLAEAWVLDRHSSVSRQQLIRSQVLHFQNRQYTQQEWSAVSSFAWPGAEKILHEQNMHFMGIDQEIYDAFCAVAEELRCLIFIRCTNSGVIEGFLNKSVTGKTMVTKGKSSEYLPTKANITFFSKLSKSPPPPAKLWNQYQVGSLKRLFETEAQAHAFCDQQPDPKPSMTKQKGEQDTLLHVPFDEDPGANGPPPFLFIPKLQSWAQICRQYGFVDANVPQPTLPQAPEWVRIRAKQQAGSITTEVSVAAEPNPRRVVLSPNATTVRYTQHAAPAETLGSDAVEFLFVKAGTFAEINQAFQQRIAGVFPNFSGSLVTPRDARPVTSVMQNQPHVLTAADQSPFYLLYVRESAVIDPADRPKWQAATPLVTSSPKPLTRAACLDLFAPVLTNSPDPQHPFRLCSVLGQAKQDGKTTRYYEIMADYDLFSICPSLDLVAQKAQLNRLDYFFPKNRPGMGLISDFEQDVKRALNKAVRRLQPPGTDEATGPSEIEVVLHGAEVNNYFFVQDFDSLIFIPPNCMRNPRFQLLSETYVRMARCDVTHEYAFPVNKTMTDYWYPPFRQDKAQLNHYYLFTYNFQWGNEQGLNHFYLYDHTKPTELFEEVVAVKESRFFDDIQQMNRLYDRQSERFRRSSFRLKLTIDEEITRLQFYAHYYAALSAECEQVQPPPANLRQVQANLKKGYEALLRAIRGFRAKLNRFQFNLATVQFPTYETSMRDSELLHGQDEWLELQEKLEAQLPLTQLNQRFDPQTAPVAQQHFDQERANLEQLMGDLDAKVRKFVLHQLSYYPDYYYCLRNRKRLEEVYQFAYEALDQISRRL